MAPLRANLKAIVSKQKLKRWAIEGAVLVAMVAVIGAWQTRAHARGPAPAFSLQTLDGKTVSLSSLAGKPVMLAFWAPWCGVCKVTADNVGRVASLVGSRKQVVSVALAYDGRASVEQYAKEHVSDGVPVLLGDDALQHALHVEAFPTFYFLDEKGQITGSSVGYTTTFGLWWRL